MTESAADRDMVGSRSASLVETVRHGHVLVITLQREAKRNAVDRNLADLIDAALNELEDDDDLWVGVLTGTKSVFSAGSDLTAGFDYSTERGGEYGVIRRQRRKPLIAAVEGLALGGGFEIVLACDLVVASTTTRFGLPEVALGLVPKCAGLFRGPRLLPPNVARELILLGQPIDAARAERLGLVNLVVDEGAACQAAVEMAEKICAQSPAAVRACLSAVNDYLSGDDEVGWQLTDAAFEAVVMSGDDREGVDAFLSKRAPRWERLTNSVSVSGRSPLGHGCR